MQSVDRISELINNLGSLKPLVSEVAGANAEKFNKILNASIQTSTKLMQEIKIQNFSDKNEVSADQDWVDPNYNFDVDNPRKPNMRELMEAISGRTVNELYGDTNSDWQSISKQASEILYGVVGSTEDTRNWADIMKSKNIVEEAQKATGKMYNPSVEIITEAADGAQKPRQYAALKDDSGSILRTLVGNVSDINETLINFGAKPDNIAPNLEEIINPELFNDNILRLLKNFRDGVSGSQSEVNINNLDTHAIQTAASALATRISNTRTLEDLENL